jgi:hypothetical protein
MINNFFGSCKDIIVKTVEKLKDSDKPVEEKLPNLRKDIKDIVNHNVKQILNLQAHVCIHD